jgi:hypothetical protein
MKNNPAFAAANPAVSNSLWRCASSANHSAAQQPVAFDRMQAHQEQQCSGFSGFYS